MGCATSLSSSRRLEDANPKGWHGLELPDKLNLYKRLYADDFYELHCLVPISDLVKLIEAFVGDIYTKAILLLRDMKCTYSYCDIHGSPTSCFAITQLAKRNCNRCGSSKLKWESHVVWIDRWPSFFKNEITCSQMYFSVFYPLSAPSNLNHIALPDLCQACFNNLHNEIQEYNPLPSIETSCPECISLSIY